MSPFYALYVTNEARAEEILAARGFETLCPTCRRFVRRGRRKELADVPLLTRYVLARIPDGRFAEVLALAPVAYVVGAGGSGATPRPIPEAIIEDLKALGAGGRLDDRPPATRARPRGVRRRGLEALRAWFEVNGEVRQTTEN